MTTLSFNSLGHTFLPLVTWWSLVRCIWSMHIPGKFSCHYSQALFVNCSEAPSCENHLKKPNNKLASVLHDTDIKIAVYISNSHRSKNPRRQYFLSKSTTQFKLWRKLKFRKSHIQWLSFRFYTYKKKIYDINMI